MLEFLHVVADGLPGRLTVLLFVGGFVTVALSGLVIAITDNKYGGGGVLFGLLMWLLSIALMGAWIVLRAGYWVVTGV